MPPNIAVLSAAAAAGAAGAGLAKYRAAFKDALREIAALNNASGDTLAFGVTPFTHLPKDEFRAIYLGGKRAPAAGERRRLRARVGPAALAGGGALWLAGVVP